MRSNKSGSKGSVPEATGIAARTEDGSTAASCPWPCRLVNAAVRRFISPVSFGAYSSLSKLTESRADEPDEAIGIIDGASGKGTSFTEIATGSVAAIAVEADSDWIGDGSQRC